MYILLVGDGFPVPREAKRLPYNTKSIQKMSRLFRAGTLCIRLLHQNCFLQHVKFFLCNNFLIQKLLVFF